MSSPKLSEYTSSVWGVFELLRGRYKRHEYGQVILPFVLLRRLDCILEPTKAKVLAAIKANPDDEMGIFARKASGYKFWNESPFTFETLAEDTANLRGSMAVRLEAGPDKMQHGVRPLPSDFCQKRPDLMRLWAPGLGSGGQPYLLGEPVASAIDEQFDLLTAMLVQQGAEFLVIKRHPLTVEL